MAREPAERFQSARAGDALEDWQSGRMAAPSPAMVPPPAAREGGRGYTAALETPARGSNLRESVRPRAARAARWGR